MTWLNLGNFHIRIDIPGAELLAIEHHASEHHVPESQDASVWAENKRESSIVPGILFIFANNEKIGIKKTDVRSYKEALILLSDWPETIRDVITMKEKFHDEPKKEFRDNDG